ncbi:MAG: IS66 family insertion sequence element accessory protein TnpB, partial [Desulfobacterium sp.]
MKNQDFKNSKNDKRRAFWQVHLDAWTDTELSQSAYCRKNNLRANQFTYWKKKNLQQDLPVEFVQVPE